MNYRHAYHAGNFADVMKHICLIRLLQALQMKSAPYCYVDSHAGRGLYELDHGPAARSGEYRGGVARLWAEPPTDLSAAADAWLRIVAALNDPDGGPLRLYPGSPYFALALAREHDRLVLSELQDDEAAALRRTLGRDGRVHIHHRDGYEALGALLPPAERRGLAFIDPPYEDAEEFSQLAAHLAGACERWPTGVVALWYPLKDAAQVARFKRTVAGSGLRKVLVAELEVEAPGAGRLYGSGMLIVNPPWQFERELDIELGGIEAILAQGRGARRVEWLVPE